MFSRRSFLKSTACVAATPLIQAHGANAIFPSDRLNLGFIGVGKMGGGHLGRFLGNDRVQVVAVCDVVTERLENAAGMVEKRYGERVKSGNFSGVKQFRDFRELLATTEIDAVVIATPDHWHAIPCVLSARAGKHIYCEKPLTHNIAEGRWLVDEVSRAKVVFQTGSQQRSEFGGHFRKAVEYIWNGRIGEVKRVRIGVGGPAKPCDLPTEEVPAGTDWDFWVGPAPMRGYNEILCPKGVHNHFPAWRSYQEFAGGGLADMGAHHFDIAQWALKMDHSAPSKIVPPEDRTTESGLRFIYNNGIEMIHNVFEGDIKADCVFEGTEGMILVSRSGISSRPGSILEQPLDSNANRVMPSSNHHANWIEAIIENKPASTICSAEIGHRSAAICHLANIGYRLRRELAWDPIAEKFANDYEANALLSRVPRSPWKI
ncbi:MAG: Gfo/Idh/MocA family oxidoreductase [Pirellula sp.]